MAFPASSDLPPRWLAAALGAVGLFALVGPAWVVANPPHIPRPHATPRHQARVVPPAELPPVEPVAFQDLTPDDARAWNASVPFADGPNPAARPFHLGGGEEDRARAIDCMAAAMLYEAGDDPVGERAVGQVVINRVRHPAFPKTICGVVFQGQERSTGCQFTFTCDGAIDRPPNPAGWERAQKLATAALEGAVYRPVGHATHYHTDWVVPYWSASLDKIAEVHTHLFFRWTGWWGTPAAFRRAVSDTEPVIAKLAALSPAHRLGAALDEAAAANASAAALLTDVPDAAAIEGGTFLLTLDKKLAADQFPAFAQATCGARDYCKLLGWRKKKETPTALPATPEQMGAMVFSYLRDRSKAFEKPLWNCTAFPRANPRECMKVQFLPASAPIVAAPAAAAPTPRATLSLPAITPAGPRTAPVPSPTPRPTATVPARPTAAAPPRTTMALPAVEPPPAG